MVKVNTKKEKPTEKVVQAAIVKWLKRKGFLVYVTTGGFYGNNGIADILAWRNGVPFAFEVKRKEGMEPTKIQQEWLDDAIKHGVIARCVGSVAEVEAIVLWSERGGMF